MKTLLSSLCLGASLFSSSLIGAEPVQRNCHCENCACTPEHNCGCFSEAGCHCTPGHSCSGESHGS